MKTSKVGPSTTVARTGRRKKTAGGGDFASELSKAAGSAPVAELTDAQGVQTVGAILSVQEVPDATERESRIRTIRYGSDLLDRLDNIRHGLLIGVVSKEELSEMAHNMRKQRQLAEDADLREIIEEIELRAEVEIAKLARDS